jgi:hypothetical protein
MIIYASCVANLKRHNAEMPKFPTTLTVVSSVRFRMVSLASYLEGSSHHPTLLLCVHCYPKKMQAGRLSAPDTNSSTYAY